MNEEMIKVTDLYKSFGKKEVLKGLNIEFSPGKITAVLGPNGSGKTTLMKSILGMVLPDSGKITLDDVDITDGCDYRNKIGYLPQIARFPENTTVSELLELIVKLRRVEKDPDPLIKYFDIESVLTDRLGHLSGGTRQKVNIVQALMFDTPYLLMDEPTAGLDPISLIRLKELINSQREEGKTILITSHIMSFVDEMADELIYILDGKIYFHGRPAQIKKDYGAQSLEGAIAKILSGLPKVGSSNGHQKETDTLVTICKAES